MDFIKIFQCLKEVFPRISISAYSWEVSKVASYKSNGLYLYLLANLEAKNFLFDLSIITLLCILKISCFISWAIHEGQGTTFYHFSLISSCIGSNLCYCSLSKHIKCFNLCQSEFKSPINPFLSENMKFYWKYEVLQSSKFFNCKWQEGKNGGKEEGIIHNQFWFLSRFDNKSWNEETYSAEKGWYYFQYSSQNRSNKILPEVSLIFSPEFGRYIT